jgi:phenylalanyl-tRNA synthetase alpha chain
MTPCSSARAWCTDATPSTGSTLVPRTSWTCGASPADPGVPDIRLLRSTDPRIAGQMVDLAPWRPVSAMPPVRRDLSVAVDAEEAAEDLGDGVREALGPDADAVEEVAVLAETGYGQLPAQAVARLGIRQGQKNVLVKVVLRHLEQTLTDEEANRMRDRIYMALHQGTGHQWSARS